MNVQMFSISLDGLAEHEKEQVFAKARAIFWSQPLYTKSPDKVLEFLDYLAEKHGTTRETEMTLYIIRLQETKQCKPRT